MMRIRALPLSLAIVMAAVGAVHGGQNADIVIGCTIFDYSNNNLSYIRSGIEHYGKGRATLLMTDARNSQTVQNELVDTLITKGAQVLAVNMVDSQSASVIIDKARSFDLPIVFFNKNPTQKDMDSYDKCWYVGVDTTNQGRLQGEMAVENWTKRQAELDRNGDGVLQYVLIMGEPGHSDTPDRTNAFEKVIAESGIKAEQLAKQPANWNTTKAKELMETWIGRYGDKIEMVISNNDSMAIGAVEALRANDLISDRVMTPVVGVNCFPEVANLVKEDIMFGSILTNPVEQGRAVVDLCINAALGNFDNITEGTEWVLQPDKSVRIPDVIVDKSNVDQAIAAYILAD